ASRHRDLAEVLEKEAEISAGTAQVEFYFRLGELRAGEVVDLDGALSAHPATLERDPTPPGARARGERPIEAASHAHAAPHPVEPLYDADGDHAKWVALSEIRVRLGGSARDQAALLERIAERLERDLKDPRRALDAAARAFALDPEEERRA